MKKNILLAFLLLIYGITFSQNINQQTIPFIEVTGNAKKEIDPNLIFVSITLSEKSIDNKKYSIENQEVRLNKIIENLGINKSNLTLSDLNSTILNDKRKEIGFKQEKEFNLKLENSLQVSKLFESLFEANIKEANVTKIDHTDIINLNKEVRIEAIKSAKAKAEYLLLAVGNKIGKPLEISEVTNDYNYYRTSLNSNRFTPISTSEFKKITITFSYRVKYSIE
jgi:uncharacterized protein YggE